MTKLREQIESPIEAVTRFALQLLEHNSKLFLLQGESERMARYVMDLVTSVNKYNAEIAAKIKVLESKVGGLESQIEDLNKKADNGQLTVN